MDPLDVEKPWGFWGTLFLITVVIGIIYLIIRIAVVIPEWGWQVIVASTAVGVALYYHLAFRGPRKASGPRVHPARALLMFLLTVAVALPLFLAAYWMWTRLQAS